VKLNEAACLKADIRSFQVVTDRLAKLVGYPNSCVGFRRSSTLRIDDYKRRKKGSEGTSED
jgi:hypothetical protein